MLMFLYLNITAAWQQYSTSLEQHGLRIEPVLPDLIDKVWSDDRPEFPDTVINPYPLKYAGKLYILQGVLKS